MITWKLLQETISREMKDPSVRFRIYFQLQQYKVLNMNQIFHLISWQIPVL